MTKNIGEFLQELRKGKGLTQRELAEQIGISDKTISKWENGNSIPDTSMLLPLCNVLEITVNEFLSCEKILPENYSMKAEENMMALIEENKRTKKGNVVSTIIGGILVCITLIFIIISCAGNLSMIGNFFDVISLSTIVLLEIGVVLSSSARTKGSVLRLISKTILPVGLLSTIISLIITLLHIIDGDSAALRANLAVVVLALLYAVVIKIVVEVLLTKE